MSAPDKDTRLLWHDLGSGCRFVCTIVLIYSNGGREGSPLLLHVRFTVRIKCTGVYVWEKNLLVRKILCIPSRTDLLVRFSVRTKQNTTLPPDSSGITPSNRFSCLVILVLCIQWMQNT